MDRRFFSRTGFGLFAGLTALFATRVGPARAADDDSDAHKVAIQVSSGERQTQQLALGNAANYANFYKAKGEPYQIEIVAFGPGYGMLRADMSMVKGEIETLQKELGSALTISACQNSRRGIARSEGKQPEEIVQLPGVKDTPSGIVRCAELQRDDWSYIRP